MQRGNNVSSRISGFYRRGLPERLDHLEKTGLLSMEAAQLLRAGGGLGVHIADRMSENVISSHGLPLSIGLNFRINHRDYLIPMAVEEPSVVAAASNAARLVRLCGGFDGDADDSIMTAQIQLDSVADPHHAAERIRLARTRLIDIGNAAIPRMVKRGGGCVDVEARTFDRAPQLFVVHVYVDVGDAMGANLVDTVAEAMAPSIAELVGGTIGLRILSNLPLRRLVRARADVSEDVLGSELADGIVRASQFAEIDPLRAPTHNKGIMNGIDAVALALGQDWRAIEAGAHAFAAINGQYAPLATWTRTPTGISGRIELPLAVGIVGGATQVHPGARAGFELVRVGSARELAVVMASVGLASNLAALKALAGEGIQRGHMALHNRRLDSDREREHAQHR